MSCHEDQVGSYAGMCFINIGIELKERNFLFLLISKNLEARIERSGG